MIKSTLGILAFQKRTRQILSPKIHMISSLSSHLGFNWHNLLEVSDSIRVGIVVIKYPLGLYMLDVSRGLMYGRKVNIAFRTLLLSHGKK